MDGKILDLPNDGVNMAVRDGFLFVRCKREMYKYDLSDMRCVAHNTVFAKDGQARYFCVGKDYVILLDFCDAYILDKNTLAVVRKMHLGTDLSDDLIAAKTDGDKAYISVRHGKIAVIDLKIFSVDFFAVSQDSFWEFCVTDKYVFIGNIIGELIKLNKSDMQVLMCNKVCSKNIYSTVFSENNGLIYTVSQDSTVKSFDADTLTKVCEQRKAVKGMCRILGLSQGRLVSADGGISFRDGASLGLVLHLDLPTGRFNKGAALEDDTVFYSDYSGVYRIKP